MSKFHLLIRAAIVTPLIAVGSNALAERICPPPIGLSTASVATYHGYSNKVAEPGAPGTSQIQTTDSSVTAFCFDTPDTPPETVGTKTTHEETYISGPGKSKFETRNPIVSTCEATGTLSCP
jgi:hypothetical protein